MKGEMTWDCCLEGCELLFRRWVVPLRFSWWYCRGKGPVALFEAQSSQIVLLAAELRMYGLLLRLSNTSLANPSNTCLVGGLGHRNPAYSFESEAHHEEFAFSA
jgi:hypothetical protein